MPSPEDGRLLRSLRWIGKPPQRIRPSIARLRIEQLENRELPVVGPLQIPTALQPGQGYDGVVRLDDSSGGIASGSLLYTGRHLLTAAHVVTDDSGSLLTEDYTITFELAGKKIEMIVRWNSNIQGVAIPPEYNGATTEGYDLAILTLPDQDHLNVPYRHMIAPLGAQRYDIYTGSSEIGQVFTMVGYGRTGTGSTGAQADTAGRKRLGMNRFDADANILSSSSAPAPNAGLSLIWDFDDGTEEGDTLGRLFGLHDKGLGARESNAAQGDSGGPLFIGSRIAGVISYSDAAYFVHQADNAELVHARNNLLRQIDGLQAFLDPLLDGSLGTLYPINADMTGLTRGFGEFGVATRVSAFQDFLATAIRDTNTFEGKYHLVLDMDYQLAGNDGKPDTIVLSRVGDAIQVSINGVVDTRLYATSELLSFTVRGSRDSETIVLRHDLGVPVFIHGEGGIDTLEDRTGSARRWTLIAPNEGRAEFRTQFEFRGISSLVSDGQGHVYIFEPGSYLTGKIITAGNGWLDYSRMNSAVAVNLLTGAASLTSGVRGIRNVLGSGTGGNRLTGDHLANILVGYGSHNILVGHGGRDILIAGAGIRNIAQGGAGDDLILGGSTAFDRDVRFLDQMMSEWNSSNPYAARIAQLTRIEALPGRLTFGTSASSSQARKTDNIWHWTLSPTTQLFGGAGQDFFVAGLTRLIKDRLGTERFL